MKMMAQTLGYYDLINIAEQNSEQSQREASKLKLPSYKGSKNKKEDSKSKQLTENVRKFLAKQDEERRQQAKEAQARKDRLNQLRNGDRKAKGRVSRMLKMTKSANKSAMEDAKDSLNDSIVDQHDELQPDDDDYGYVSQASIDMHKKLLAQYKTIKKSTPQPPQHVKDVPVPEVKSLSKGRTHASESETKKKKKPPPSAMLSYLDLLTLAEEKKDIPPAIMTQQPNERKDEEHFEFGRPMTAKEKKEYMAEKALRDRVARQIENGTFKHKTTSAPVELQTPKAKKSVSFKIPKSEKASTPPPTKTAFSAPKLAEALRGGGKSILKPVPEPVHTPKLKSEPGSPHRSSAKVKPEEVPRFITKVKSEPLPQPCVKVKPEPLEHETEPTAATKTRKPLSLNPYMDFVPNVLRRKPPSESNNPSTGKSAVSRDNGKNVNPPKEVKQSSNVYRERSRVSRDVSPPIKKCRTEPSYHDSLSRNGPPIRPAGSGYTEQPRQRRSDHPVVREDRERPKIRKSADVYEKPRSHQESRPMKPQRAVQYEDRRRPPIPESFKKGRHVIESDDEEEDEDEDDYDSDLGDFIDDTDYNDSSISAMIRQITGYDKRKYRPEEDGECMETSAYDQMREESRSLRIGIKEDLEDMRLEEEEKKRKMIKQKQSLKQQKPKRKGLF